MPSWPWVQFFRWRLRPLLALSGHFREISLVEVEKYSPLGLHRRIAGRESPDMI